MQWCVVDPQPSLMLQKHLLKHTTWIRTLVVEPTCKYDLCTVHEEAD